MWCVTFWANSVEAWRFAVALSLCGWAGYGLYRCKRWVQRRIDQASSQTTDLVNRLNEFAKTYDNRFDKLDRAVDNLQRAGTAPPAVFSRAAIRASTDALLPRV